MILDFQRGGVKSQSDKQNTFFTHHTHTSLAERQALLVSLAQGVERDERRAAHDKHITLQEVEKAPKVHVRQLSNIEKNHIVRKKMMDRCVRARRRPELADSARAPRLSFPKAAR